IVVSLPSKINKKEVLDKKYILWPLAGALAVGFSDTLTKHIIDQTSTSTFVFTLAIINIPIGFIFLKLEKQSIRQFNTIFNQFMKYQFSIYGAALNIIGTLFLLLSFQFA